MADDVAVEYFAVWAYGRDEGALASRRCVVVVAATADEGEAERARRWNDAYQNLYIMPSGGPLAKFLDVRLPPPN